MRHTDSWATIGKSQSGLPHLLLLRVIQAAFSHHCRWRSSGLPPLATSESDQDYLLLLLVGTICWWVLFTCQSVTLSLPFCCFMERSNLSTQTWGFWVLAHGAGGLGEWIPVEMVGQGVRILLQKFQPISSTFTPWKSQIPVLFGMGPL